MRSSSGSGSGTGVGIAIVTMAGSAFSQLAKLSKDAVKYADATVLGFGIPTLLIGRAAGTRLAWAIVRRARPSTQRLRASVNPSPMGSSDRSMR